MSEPKKEKKRNLLQRLIGWFTDLFAWVKETLADEEARKAMMTDLGLPPDTSVPINIPQGSIDSIDRYRKSKDPNDAAFLEALKDIQEIIAAVRAFIKEAGISGEAAIEEYTHRFFELMMLSYIRLHQPALYWLAQPLGFIEESLTAHSTAKTYPKRIVSFFKGIGDHFDDLDWGKLETEQQAKAVSDLFFLPLSLGLPHLDRLLTGPTKKLAGDIITDILYGWEIVGAGAPPLADQVSDRTLSLLVRKSPNGTEDTSISCTMMLAPRAHGGPGLFLAFGGSGEIESELSDGWKFKFGLKSANAIDFLIRLDRIGIDANALTDAGATFSIEAAKNEAQEPFVIGISQRSRLEFGRLSFSGGISAEGAGVKLAAAEGALVIAAARDADGFISQTLPANETRIAFNLGIGLSNERGLYIEGGSGLRALFPIAKSLGPVTIQNLLLSLTPNSEQEASNLVLEAGASLDVRFGPVKANVDQIGFRVKLDFARKNPNLVFADLSFGFKPPNGVGLAIDSAVVDGGGFLFFDSEKAQYAGVVHLQLEGGLALKALGLLTTRMPNGARVFSLLVIITADGFKPIPIGFGFMLAGIGGLLGINRTFNEEALLAGVRNRTLDSVLFPKDPIRNAQQYLSVLDSVFPSAKDHYIFGPMARITWGTPPLLTINLALAIEFGARLRLAVMGQLSAILPKKENDLVRLQADAVGIVDFDRKTAAFDAAIYDSRLAKKFVITGQMAMRMNWGDSPNFALAVGGFHPAFQPPAGFPKLKRVAIEFSASKKLKLHCEAYFALTSNTVQFGGLASLSASAAGFTVVGSVGFNVLIQFDPFHFIVDFHVSLQLKRGSRNLFKVKVEGKIEGPRPLHLLAKATFEIFWFDISFKFEKTLVSGERPPLPEPVDVLTMLRASLVERANWTAITTGAEQRLVTLREGARDNELTLHPMNRLSVRQRVVPLNVEISRFGSARPSGQRRFEISEARINDEMQTIEPLTDHFAPAQFFDLSDDEKLSRPSFETMSAGMQFGSNKITFGAQMTMPLEYEEKIVDMQKKESVKSPVPYKLSAETLWMVAHWGAVRQSLMRRAGRLKYQAAGIGFKLSDQRYVLASIDDLTVPEPSDTNLTYTEAKERLRGKAPQTARLLQVALKLN